MLVSMAWDYINAKVFKDLEFFKLYIRVAISAIQQSYSAIMRKYAQ